MNSPSSRTRRIPAAAARREFAARLEAPFAVLGIVTVEDWLTAIEYLPLATPRLAPTTPLAREVAAQVTAYLADARFEFDLPLHLAGTAFQKRVWQRIRGIPAGATASYGALAHALRSAPRAVGQACRANRLPLVIPCHRVVAQDGGLGGFMGASGGAALGIKRWLIEHERRR